MKFVPVFAVLLFSTTIHAQNIDAALQKLATQYAQEKTYLHFDKSTYSPGETVWFKAYLMKGIEPADESKTLYTDWTDESGKLLFHSVSPVVDAGSNGQFDIPADYKGRYIHVKAYTKWMLNFDSAFLYEKDIRIITKENIKTAAPAIQPQLSFFPEGGDMIAGIANKIAFKINDQWGKPLSIKGIITSSKGEKLDSIRVMHDGMGFFFLHPVAGETYTAKWKDQKGTDHITSLPAVKPNGVIVQVSAKDKKQSFSISADPQTASTMKSVHVVGTMNQYQVFNITKDISSGAAGGTIPTADLPSGILVITVFDPSWNALSERISFINNGDYLLPAEMSVEHWGLNKRARNEIQVSIPDSIAASFSISVTDGGIDSDSSNTIISHFLLSSELKGQVYNPAYYFNPANEKASQYLDLVMMTHGWRRFQWEDVVKNKFPAIKYPKDTSFLSLSGKVYGAAATAFRENNPNVVLILSQKDATTKKNANQMLVVPIRPDGTFNESNFFLFDTAHVYYKLSKGLSGASINFMEARLPALGTRLPAAGLYYNQRGDTAGFSKHFQLSDETLRILQEGEGKVLDNVIVKAKTKTAVELADEKYTSGLFSGRDAYQFNVMDDQFTAGARNVFEYLQSKVAGLMINTGANPPTMSWRGGSPQIYLDEMPMDAEFVSSLSVNDIAYIKVFRPPFAGSSNGANGAIAIYTRKGDDVRQSPGQGLNSSKVTGYTPVRQFYSPNYSSFVAANEKKDLRTTLYWNPQLVAKPGQNKVKFTFYNNDISKSFRIIIEGMSNTGQLVHLEQVME